MRITLVFILTLVLPSVLLSAFALQAIDAERRARLAERSDRLQATARELVHALDEVLRRPARRVQAQVAQLRVTRAREAGALLAPLLAEEPLLRGVLVLDERGSRVYPAGRSRPRPAPAPALAPAALGGVVGAVAPPDAADALRAAAQLDPEAAVALFEGVARRGDAAARAAALHDLGHLHEASGNLTGLLNARDAYGALVRAPIDLTDAWGRPAAAHGRLRLALVYHALKYRTPCLDTLRGLLAELEASADALPADAVAELAERAGALLQSEGDGEALVRALALVTRRQQVEATYARLEDLFGQALQAALRAPAPDAAARYTTPGVLAGAPGDEPGPASAGGVELHPGEREVDLLKARSGDVYELATYARLRGRSGAPVGVVAVRLDLDALERAFRARARLAGADLVARAAETAAADVVVVPLHAPLDHVALRVHAPPEERLVVSDALDLPRDTVYLWAIALSIGGIAAGVLVTTRTVQRESKAAQLKTDFVSNVTHELKTPLTSIRMFLETLMLGRVSDPLETRECLEVMSKETERLTRLIDKLLAFSRIEGKKWRLRLGFEDPRELVEEAVCLLANQLGSTPEACGIEVVAVQDLPQIAVDRVAIVEVFLNLLHNAWKYSPGPERHVRVVLTARRRHVEVAFEDNGIGVPRRDRRRIFVKFERGSNAEQLQIEGSGIGLTVALSLVKAHGGTIQYAPLKPRGSRFSVVLPK